MAEKTELEKAIDALRSNQTGYAKTDRYYDGEHDLAFATAKFENAFGNLFREFSLNLCPAVVDALRDKLVVTGFRVEQGSDSISDNAWKIWQDNRMGKRSGEIHKEAVRNGDAYAIVWVNPEKRVTIYPQRAASCTVEYDPESPGKILWAAKYWLTTNERVRLNLYHPDRIERLISKKTTKGTLPSAKEFVEFEPAIPNPYGRVPVFHFANNADVGSFGRSELKDVLSIQDGLNKAVLDMLVAMEFAAFRQRWISGIEIEYDDTGKPIAPFKSGAEQIWLTESPDTKFGDFDHSELKQFLDVKDSFRTDFATVTGTPLYYFMQTGANFPQSGESYRRAETRFIHKVRDRHEAFGNVWEEVMGFALEMENKGRDLRLFTEWEEPGRLSEREELENLLLKKDIGVTDEQLMTEAGYGASEIGKMMAEKAAAQENMVRGFNRGEIKTGEEKEV